MIVALAAPVAAQPPAASGGGLAALMACRGIGDTGARLACFDRESAALQRAEAARDVVVVDRATMQKTRRSLFGIALPRIDLFGGGDRDKADDRQRPPIEEITQIEAKLAQARRRPDGKWLFVLEDGARWAQTDTMRLDDARPGDTIRIRRAAMGSFLANVAGQTAVRVRREVD